MSNNLQKRSLGSIELQSGNGVPTHSASLGSQYTNIDTGILYKNIDGNTTWITDTSVTGYTYDGLNTFTILKSDGTTHTAQITSLSATNLSGNTISSGTTNLDLIFTQDAFTTFSSTTAGETSVIADSVNDQINFSGINVNILTDDTNKIITFSASTGGGGADGNDYVTGTTKEGNAAVVRRDDGTAVLTLSGGSNVSVVSGGTNLMRLDVDIPTITQSIDFRAEEFALNTASRVTLTPLIMSAVRFAGAGAVDDSGISFTVPQDYLSGASIGIVWQTFSSSSTSTAKTSFDIYTGDTNNTGDLTTIQETINIYDTPETSGNVFIHSPFENITTAIKAGDSLHMRVYRTPGDSEDTLTDNLDLINLIFKYTATR